MEIDPNHHVANHSLGKLLLKLNKHNEGLKLIQKVSGMIRFQQMKLDNIIMKRLKLENNQTNFIGIWNIQNDELCKKIINFFEKNIDLQKDGATGDGKNKNFKQTTDINIHPKNLANKNYKDLKDYIDCLHKCYQDYLKQWPFLNDKINTVDIPTLISKNIIG